MTNKVLGTAFAALVAGTTMSAAAVIDFETAGPEGTVISNQFQASEGVVFSLGGGGAPVIAETGAPRTAFQGSGGADGIAPVDELVVGSFFLTDDGVTSGGGDTLIVTYDTATDQASADILDIDFNEEYGITLWDAQVGGNLLDTIVISSGDADTGNGIATQFSFTRATADVFRIEIAAGPNFTGFLGLGFDNFDARSANPSAVPLPAALPLLAGALGVFGLIRRRG